MFLPVVVLVNWGNWTENHCPDQSEYLPNFEDVRLAAIPYLNKGDDFDAWLQEVTEALDSQGLMSLISETTPRPLFFSEKSKNWADISQAVAGWMQFCISDDTLHLDIMEADSENIDFADSFMKNIKKVFRPPQSQADAKNIKRLVQLKRADFDTSVKYVMAYADHFRLASEHGITMAPYAALLTILVNIKHSDRWVYYEVHRMLQVDSGENQDLSKWVTMKLFQYYINEIVTLLVNHQNEQLKRNTCLFG
ncbi:hypothetical protein N7504_003392 [Penicillium tannophilum]|nr:hypothetical protein N7504_003392 [Penicillium tannophilum]